jgi:LAO/AO transport system kinase
MGDEVQAIKAGLLEVADLVVVNKGDRPGADLAARHLRAMLSTAGGRVSRQPPPIMITSAISGDGVAPLADAIEAHRSQARSPEAMRIRAGHQLQRSVAELAVRRAAANPAWNETLQAVADHELDPITAARRLMGEDA